jgi:hypothetical protein
MYREDFEKRLVEAIKEYCPELSSEIAEAVMTVIDDVGIVPPKRRITCGEYLGLDENDPNYNNIYRFGVHKWDKKVEK